MNKSRKIPGLIRELMEVSVEAIEAKLPLLFQTLSQLVGACWKVEDFVKLARGEPVSATQSLYVNLIYEFCQLLIGISNIIITRPTRFCSALLFTTHAAHTLYV